MQHLFDYWETFASDVKSTPHVLLLSDYDGTLTPIVSRPEEALLSAGIRDTLQALSIRPDFSVGVISGRSLEAIKEMVGLGSIYYAGNHGLEIEGPGLSFVSLEAGEARAVIGEVVERLTAGLGGIEGVIIEDKGLSLSVHYRLVREDEVARVADIFQQITAPLLGEGKIRITSGKKVWEVRPPVDWHKGKAVEVVTRELKVLLKLEQLLTIYLGDDTTDEDAFRIVRRPQGWSIYVGGNSPASSAEYFLNSTAEAEDFLTRLLALK